MTDTEIKKLFEANGRFATGKDYALIRAFETIIRQQRTWVGLTDEDMAEITSLPLGTCQMMLKVEAKLKAKNGP